MSTETFLMILTIALVALAAFVIPLLLQLRSTIQRADDFLRKTQQDLDPLLKEAHELTRRLNVLVQDVERGVEAVAPVFDVLGEARHTLKKVSGFMHGDAFQYVGNALGMWLGIRAATKTIFREFKKRKGED